MWNESFVGASRGSLLIMPLGNAVSLHLLTMNVNQRKLSQLVML